jgi:outer membrane receptor protein involved in Fe transport
MSYQILAASMLYSGVALAQETSKPSAAPAAMAQDAGEGQLGEIIVTAQKRSERLVDVPLSITAATGDQLAKLGVNGPADLEKVALGFTFRPSIYGSPIFQIRGVGFFEESIGIAPTVSIYVDQVPLPYSAMAEGAALDIERVEVLKGPQGTLFGQNSTGGAVNYIAAKPTDVLKMGLDASYGRFAATEIGGFVSGPLSDTLTARVSVKHEGRGDWQQSITSDRTSGQRDFVAGRLLLDWQASDSVDFELNLNGWRDKSDTQAQQFVQPSLSVPGNAPLLDIYPQLLAYPTAPKNGRIADWDPDKSLRRDDSFYQAALRANVQLSDSVTLTSISSYAHLKVFRPTDVDGTALLSLFTTSIGQIESYYQELRLDGAMGDDRLKWMIGANYGHDKTGETQDLQFNQTNLFVGPFNFRYAAQGFESKVDTGGVFASVDYKLTDTLSAQGSVRYTKHKIDYSGCTRSTVDGSFGVAIEFLSEVLSGTPTDPIPVGACTTLDATTFKPLPIVKDKLDEDNLSWRAGLSWKPDQDALIYANVTKGYKAGNFANVTGIVDSALGAVPQESVLAFEAGFKASLFDRKLQAAGALFYLDYRRKQLVGFIPDPVFGALNSIVSIPKSRVKGGELEVTLRPIEGLSLRVGGTYVDSQITGNFIAFDAVGVAIDRAGESFPGTPKWQLISDAEYEFPAWSEWSAFFGGGVTYRSKTKAYFGNNPLFDLPAYALVDLRAGFRSDNGKYRVQFWGRNVGNKFFVAHASATGDVVSRVAGMPATYGVSVSTRF